MKTNYILIALAMIAALTMVSCKNSNKKAQSQEPTQEEVQEMKQALADSVLTYIDAIADEYFVASENTFRIPNFELSEEEKMVKPDFLLEPSFANTLVTKSQKINALGIYLIDLAARIIYDMPLDETKEVITKLAVELNLDANTDFEMPLSEKIKKEYENSKARGELAYFWQFENAIIAETGYILAQNPELFFSHITEEQWQQYLKRTDEKNKAMRELARYDEEMATVWEIFSQNSPVSSPEELSKVSASIESEKQFRIANKDKFIAKRNALLQ